MASKQEVDVFLTEAMGVCFWIGHECPKCKPKSVSRRPGPIDFSTWDGFGVLWGWSKQKWWFDNFILGLQATHKGSDIRENLQEGVRILQIMQFVSPAKFATSIYAYLKEQK